MHSWVSSISAAVDTESLTNTADASVQCELLKTPAKCTGDAGSHHIPVADAEQRVLSSLEVMGGKVPDYEEKEPDTL